MARRCVKFKTVNGKKRCAKYSGRSSAKTRKAYARGGRKSSKSGTKGKRCVRWHRKNGQKYRCAKFGR